MITETRSTEFKFEMWWSAFFVVHILAEANYCNYHEPRD